MHRGLSEVVCRLQECGYGPPEPGTQVDRDEAARRARGNVSVVEARDLPSGGGR
jgi:hypothetical protein